MTKLAIPNREVRSLYRQIIEQWLSNGADIERYNSFISALLEGRIEDLGNYLQDVLLQIASVHDMAKEPEAFFHGLVLGFISSLHTTYVIQSNRESGLGRFDIMLLSRAFDTYQAGIVLELKIQQGQESLEDTAERALAQIREQKYASSFKHTAFNRPSSLGLDLKEKNVPSQDV